jgi:nucleoside phosphorylase
MPNRPAIFISATSDLRSARDLVGKVLYSMGYEPSWQDLMSTDGGELLGVLGRRIAEASLVVQLIGMWYGPEPPRPSAEFGRVSYTQFEALEAERLKKKVIYYLLDDRFPTDPVAPEPPELISLQAAYRQGLADSDRLYYGGISSAVELEVSIRRIERDLDVLRRQTHRLRIRETPSIRQMPADVMGRTLAPRPDVLLVTVNEHETRAVHDEFEAATGAPATTVPLDGRVYRNLGTLNGTTVFHALSEMGSAGVGAMQQTVDKAVRALDPAAVIAVGLAFGINKKRQAVGDILVSKQLRPYDLQRVGSEIILRDDKPHATPRLINHFGGFAHTAWQGPSVRLGVLLSGDKLVDDIDYRNALLTVEREAIGGEMEGAGLYVPCYEHKVDWIVIKAICDWADGNKAKYKTARQKRAARNSVQFLIQALQNAPLKRQS